jgi:hypothetical protein
MQKDGRVLRYDGREADTTNGNIKDAVKSKYGEAARRVTAGEGAGSGSGGSKFLL